MRRRRSRRRPRARSADAGDRGAASGAARARAADGSIAVSELLRAARLTLESRFADVRVEGEVSGLKRSGPGHLYFCLKDEEARSTACCSRARRRG